MKNTTHWITIAAATALGTSLLACSSAPSHESGQGGGAPLVRSQFAEGDLAKLCQQSIDQTQARMDAIGKLAPAARTMDSTLIEFENATADLSEATQPLGFMKYVSPNKVTNAEGAKCEKDTGDFLVKILG